MATETQAESADWFATRQLDARTWAIDDRGQDLIYLVYELRCDFGSCSILYRPDRL